MRHRLSRVVFALTATCAALLAHVAIDIAGDVLLPRDAYDDVAHHSRELTFAIACVLAAIVLDHTLRGVRAELRGSRGSLRALLRASLPATWARFVIVVSLLALPALIAMSGLDALLDARPVDDFGDLLGGSIPLGLACILGSSVAVALCVWKAIRACASLDTLLFRLACILAERTREACLPSARQARCGTPARSAASICARSIGLRAPPQTA